MFSVKDAIHRYAATLEKVWSHDRGATVGASEIGNCARKTFFSKTAEPRDPEYHDSWGARERGNLIENFWWLPALRSQLPEGAQLLYAGDEQNTLTSGYLSGTTDGLLVFDNGVSINLDNKSFDPRISIRKPKPEHMFQVQVQVGLIRECTEHRPDTSILSYVNASWLDDVREYVIPWNPRTYQAAQSRARNIMTARNALDLPPEGKLSGGSECAYCAWSSHCSAVTVAGVPKDEQPLDDATAACLKALRDAERELADAKESVALDHARSVENIKEFLREHNTRRYKGRDWSVYYSITNGRTTLDIAAIEAAGLDLSPYYKTGNQSDRITIR